MYFSVDPPPPKKIFLANFRVTPYVNYAYSSLFILSSTSVLMDLKTLQNSSGNVYDFSYEQEAVVWLRFEYLPFF